jgi:hypothetical protein
MLVGNKSDLQNKRAVTFEQGKELADSLKGIFNNPIKGFGVLSEYALRRASMATTSVKREKTKFTKLQPALEKLVRDGVGLEGKFVASDAGELSLWSRRLITRARRRMLERLRQEIDPIPAQDFMRFLFIRHGVTTESQRRGRDGKEPGSGRHTPALRRRLLQRQWQGRRRGRQWWG